MVAGSPLVDFVHGTGRHDFTQAARREDVIQLYVSGRYVSGNRVICDNFARIGFQTFRFRIGLTPVWVLGSHVAQAQRGHAIHNRLGTGRKLP